MLIVLCLNSKAEFNEDRIQVEWHNIDEWIWISQASNISGVQISPVNKLWGTDFVYSPGGFASNDT